MDNQRIAEALFPNTKHTAEEYLNKYEKRILPEGSYVTRFAPSPTGFMHLGNFFQAYISFIIAKMSGGVFYLRNEDTDQKRKVDDAMEIVFDTLQRYGVMPDEYEIKGHETKGRYAPYIQTERKDIYQAFAKKLVAEGKAFPCFCKKTEGLLDIEKKREKSFALGLNVEKDPCRNLSEEQILENVKQGKSFSIRLKSRGDGKGRVEFFDVLKGKIEMEENAKDAVLLKSDGLPTYHFAHPIDDTLMGTTLVVRGEEWLPSTPLHLEIFSALNFPRIKYLHNPLICTIEGDVKRKLSKRKDKEADMRFYAQEGYPKEVICEYMLSLINSGFEPWRIKNPNAPLSEFRCNPLDVTASSPMLDIQKLNSISKDYFAKLGQDDLFYAYKAWAEEFDEAIYDFIEKKPQYVKDFINIDRNKPKPRKDIYNFAMIAKEEYDFMFTEPEKFELPKSDYKKFEEFLREYQKNVLLSSKEEWFENIKQIAQSLGYATDNKLYKQNPKVYKGNTATVCQFLRIAITGKTDSPDLYDIMRILGNDRSKHRIDKAIEKVL